MKLQVAAVAFAVSVPSLASAQMGRPSETGDYVANLNFFLGQKTLDNDDWGDDLDQHDVFGVEATWGMEGWPVGIATDLLLSRKSKKYGPTTITASTTDFSFGARKIFELKRIRPHVGAGGSYIGASFSAEGAGTGGSAQGNGFGWWAGGGAFYRLGKSANLGVSVRYADASADSGDFSKAIEAGGLTYGVILGVGFPGYDPGAVR